MLRFFLCLLLFFPLKGEETLYLDLEVVERGAPLVPLYIEKGNSTPYRSYIETCFTHNGVTEIKTTPDYAEYTLKIEEDIENYILYIKGPSSQKLTYPKKNNSSPMKAACRLHDLFMEKVLQKEGVFSYPILSIEYLPKKQYSLSFQNPLGGEKTVFKTSSTLLTTPHFLPTKNLYQPHAFAYVDYEKGQPKILIFSVIERKSYPWVDLRGGQLMPVFTKKETAYAFISDAAGNPDLFYQEIDEQGAPKDKPRQIFTRRYATQASPCFSPSGKEIAFVSDFEGNPGIYKISIPKKDTPLKKVYPQRVSKSKKEATSPHFSPDGSKIVYALRDLSGTRQIAYMDFKTGKETFLTEGPPHKENPFFSPQGEYIIFNTLEKEQGHLGLIHLDHKKMVILPINGDFRFPVWPEPKN